MIAGRNGGSKNVLNFGTKMKWTNVGGKGWYCRSRGFNIRSNNSIKAYRTCENCSSSSSILQDPCYYKPWPPPTLGGCNGGVRDVGVMCAEGDKKPSFFHVVMDYFRGCWFLQTLRSGLTQIRANLDQDSWESCSSLVGLGRWSVDVYLVHNPRRTPVRKSNKHPSQSSAVLPRQVVRSSIFSLWFDTRLQGVVL